MSKKALAAWILLALVVLTMAGSVINELMAPFGTGGFIVGLISCGFLGHLAGQDIGNILYDKYYRKEDSWMT